MDFKEYKDFQLDETRFTKIKWTLPSESPALKIEGEVENKKVILYIDSIEKSTAKPEWEFEKEDVAILFAMYYKDKPKYPINILMSIKDAQRFYDRFNSILKNAETKKETNKEKTPPGGDSGGMGGFGGGGFGSTGGFGGF